MTPKNINIERLKAEHLQGDSRVSRRRSSVLKSEHIFLVINPSNSVAIVATALAVWTFCALVLECDDLLTY